MCVSVRPSDDVLGAFSVAELATEIFYGGTGHRDHDHWLPATQVLMNDAHWTKGTGGGQQGGGASTGGKGGRDGRGGQHGKELGGGRGTGGGLPNGRRSWVPTIVSPWA